MKRLLATGISGFVGGHLRAALEGDPGCGYELVYPETEIDLRDARQWRDWLGEVRPEAVIHLGGQSNVVDAFADPRATLEVNTLGTLNLLLGLRAAGFAGRMLFVSSGDVYGLVDDDCLPVRETMPPRPRNPYAVSKVAAEALCYQWTQSEGMAIVIARPFNHIGPGQDERFAVASYARQIAAVKLGLQEPVLEVGDTEVTRDFTDVEDIVRAYLALLAHGDVGATYNIGSDREVRLGEILDTLCRLAGTAPRITRDARRMRPTEQRRMRASTQRLRERTGWVPRVPLETSLARILTYWERRLSQ